MALQDVKQIETLTINGNGALKSVASIAEVQVKAIWNNNQNLAVLRWTATADSLNDLNGVGTAVYRIPTRNVFGTDYNTVNGITRQATGAKHTVVQLDQHLTINLPMEGFDLDRFLNSSPAVRATLVSEWISSAERNKMHNYELIFLRALHTYAVANYGTEKNVAEVIDFAGIKTADEALAAYYKILDIKTDMISTVSDDAVGFNPEDLLFAISMKGYNGLVKSHTKFIISDKGLNSLTTGKLFSDNVMGLPMQEHFFLGRNFAKGVMNKDIEFNIAGMQAFMLHKDAVAAPLGTQRTEMLANIDSTLNTYYVSKNLGALPQIIRPAGVKVFLTKAPTADEITKARALIYTGTKSAYEEAVQLATYDALGTLPTPPEETKKSTK